MRSEVFAISLTAIAVVTNMLLLYAGILTGIKPFSGVLPEALKEAHMPDWRMWLPPLLLGIAGLILGLFPVIIEGVIVRPAFHSIYPQSPEFRLKLWHGFNTVLVLSAVTIAGGLLLYFLFKPSIRLQMGMATLSKASPRNMAHFFSKKFRAFATVWTRLLQNGYLRIYVLMIISFLTVLLAYKSFTQVAFDVDVAKISPLTSTELVVMFILIAAVMYAVYTPSRLAAIATMGVIGYCVCLIYVFYSAPDLAMTQFAIDTLTVILFILVLYRLPKYINYSSWPIRVRDGLISLTFGTLITILGLETLYEPTDKETTRFVAENAYTLAKGKNVVNVILVDFRGIDTMVEITVLTIAALGVFALLKLQLDKYDQEL